MLLVAIGMIAVSGCGDEDSDGSGGDSDSDSDTDSDSDSDSDSDADSDTDADADTDTDCEWSFSTAQEVSFVLAGIAGYGADSIVAVGNGTTYFDGSSWAEVSLPQTAYLSAVWLYGADAAVAVGMGCDTFTFNGTDWTYASSNTCTYDLQDVWATSFDERFAAAGYLYESYPQGKAMEWNDGGEYWLDPMGTTEMFYGIWGSSPSDIKIVGGAGYIFGYDGSNWNPEYTMDGSQSYLAVHGCGSSDIWAVGTGGLVGHYTGSTPWAETTIGTGYALRDVSCQAADTVFACGEAGTFAIYDGSAWNFQTTGYTEDFNGLYAVSETEVYITASDGSSSKIVHGVCE